MWSASYHRTEETSRFILSTGLHCLPETWVKSWPVHLPGSQSSWIATARAPWHHQPEYYDIAEKVTIRDKRPMNSGGAPSDQYRSRGVPSTGTGVQYLRSTGPFSFAITLPLNFLRPSFCTPQVPGGWGRDTRNRGRG